MRAECILPCPHCGAALHLGARVKAEPVVLAGAPRTSGRFGLTKREAMIADLVLAGMRYAEVAKQLGTSEQMVKNIVSHQIYNKVGCSNQAEFFSIVFEGKGAAE